MTDKKPQTEQKHAGGRPPLFESAEILQEKIDEYFKSCDDYSYEVDYEDEEGNPCSRTVKSPQPYTMAGLARWLDCDRRTIVNYSGKDEFFPTIKRARLKIEEQLEKALFGKAVTGVIFNLKNNYGWKDQQEIDHTSGGEKLKAVNVNVLQGKELDEHLKSLLK